MAGIIMINDNSDMAGVVMINNNSDMAGVVMINNNSDMAGVVLPAQLAAVTWHDMAWVLMLGNVFLCLGEALVFSCTGPSPLFNP